MTSAGVSATSLANDDALGVSNNSRDVIARLVEWGHSTVLTHRSGAGVIRGQCIHEAIPGEPTYQTSIHTVQCSRGVNCIDRVPNICNPVAITVHAILLPGPGHELRDPLCTGG